MRRKLMPFVLGSITSALLACSSDGNDTGSSASAGDGDASGPGDDSGSGSGSGGSTGPTSSTGVADDGLASTEGGETSAASSSEGSGDDADSSESGDAGSTEAGDGEGGSTTGVDGPCGIDDPCPEGQVCVWEIGDCGTGTTMCAMVPQICPLDFDPQCGCDGMTYANECMAYSAGVSIDHPGEC